MSPDFLDLTIGAAMADPVLRAVLRADRLDPAAFETTLREAARRLKAVPARGLLGSDSAPTRTSKGAPARMCFA